MVIALTDRERAVLAHAVVDPDAWVAHVEAQFDEAVARQMLDDKVAVWGGRYDAALAADGEAYMTRAEREASA